MADLGTVGKSASAGSGGTYVPAPLGLTGVNFTPKDAEPLPFTVPPTELVGMVPI